MKFRPARFIFLALFLAASVFAAASASVPSAAISAPSLASDQLAKLLGPIALYPDPLIALMLPASTVPLDVVLAARYFNQNGDPARVDEQPWDDSVKGLAHYQNVIIWMDENLAWSLQLGEAFINQPAEVMKTIQYLRAEARAAGTLVDTPQQQLDEVGGNIIIVPAQPNVIYVPVYNADVVYLARQSFYAGPFLTFGVGYATGVWLGYDFDWERRRFWMINERERERYWRDHRELHRPNFPGPARISVDRMHTPWVPNPARFHPTVPLGNRPRPDIVRPSPYSLDRDRRSIDGPRGPGSVPFEHGPVGRDQAPFPPREQMPSPDRARLPPRRPELVSPPPAVPVQPQSQAPAPGYNRGVRVAPEDRPRINPSNNTPPNAPAAGGLIRPPVQPNMNSPQPAPAASRQDRRPPAAPPQPVPPAQPAASSPPQDEKASGRGRDQN
jgi:hypothetical protein